MRTTERNNQARWLSGLFCILSLSMMLVYMNACGKDRNTVGVVRPPGGCVGANCTGGTGVPPGGGTLLVSAFGGSGFNYFEMGMAFWDSQGAGGAGPVTATGSVYFHASMSGHTCAFDQFGNSIFVPEGMYSVGNTTQTGMYDGAINNLSVQLVGPGVVVDAHFHRQNFYQANPAYFWQATGEQFPSYQWGSIEIRAINGIPCMVPLVFNVD